MPPDIMQWEGHFTSLAFSPKIHNLSLIIRKPQIEEHPTNIWLVLSKSVKDSLKNCHRLEENMETWHLNAMSQWAGSLNK